MNVRVLVDPSIEELEVEFTTMYERNLYVDKILHKDIYTIIYFKEEETA